MNLKMSVLLRSLLAASLVSLAACGGSDGTTAADGSGTPAAPTTTPTPTVQAGSATGILTDSPIGGVEYITSGGYRGFTDANGNYHYEPGESVEFRIGGISLGTVEATGTVTPLELAGNDAAAANKVVNLLVLLQSLDADGNPENGITITETARTAAGNVTSLDLTVAPATFSSASTLTTLLTNSGVSATPVSTESATAHFKTQFMTKLAGGWMHASADSLVVIRFAADGSYLIGENGVPDDSVNGPGVEQGRIDWNPSTGAITLVPDSLTVDTNGDWGLSSVTGSEVLSFDGEKLVFKDFDGSTTTFTRIPTSETNPVVGLWTLAESDTDMSRQHFVFFASGNYLMIDQIGDEDTVAPCGGPGIERGTYTYDASTGAFAVTGTTRDQNDCAGLWDSTAETGQEGTRATVDTSQVANGVITLNIEGDGPVPLRRVRP